MKVTEEAAAFPIHREICTSPYFGIRQFTASTLPALEREQLCVKSTHPRPLISQWFIHLYHDLYWPEMELMLSWLLCKNKTCQSARSGSSFDANPPWPQLVKSLCILYIVLPEKSPCVKWQVLQNELFKIAAASGTLQKGLKRNLFTKGFSCPMSWYGTSPTFSMLINCKCFF